MNYDYKNLRPFKWFVLQNFPFIEADFDAITNWQLFCKLGEEINKLINSINSTGEQVESLTNAFNNLEAYVNNYFENLDIQEEINEKLDEMAEAGTLEEIIGEYLSIKALLVFDNVSNMKNGTNLVNGSYIKTLGYYEKGDGGASYYKVREITNQDIIDDKQIIPLNISNTLIAEFINTNKKINPLQFGAKGDGITDDTAILQYTLNYASTKHIEMFIPTPNNYYLISSGLNVPEGIASLVCEKSDYYGVIRPSGSNYTAITFESSMNFICKNLSVGSNSENAPLINGILMEGHCGINNFENIRVCNLNGFGMKINAIWDSVFTNISIEKCGNDTEYAFSLNDDGDTCNMSTFNRIQVEQSNKKAIYISPLTLSCEFIDIHSERNNALNSDSFMWSLGGNHCKYSVIRLNVLNNITDDMDLCLFNGAKLNLENLLIENHINCVFEGINGTTVYCNNSTFSSLVKTLTNQRGQITFENCSLSNLLPDLYMKCFNCDIGNLTISFSPFVNKQYAKFYNCSINEVYHQTSQSTFFADNCQINLLNAHAIDYIIVNNSTINTVIDNESLEGYVRYSGLFAINTTFNSNVIFDYVRCNLKHCIINGNMDNIFGNNVHIFRDCVITGSVGNSLTSIPTFSTDIGTITENLRPTSGSYIGWVNTANGWKGYGTVA